MRVFGCSLTVAALLAGFCQAQLLVDFDSTTQDRTTDANGETIFHAEPGFDFYEAGHEVASDFVAREYMVFGSTVSLTPTWPDTTANTTMQAIDRGNQSTDPPTSFDATWLDVSDLDAGTVGLNLVTDWLGVDTRTGNGGNGDWDGTTGTPSTFALTLSGLPASDYTWKSYHHDTENIHGEFEVQISTDGGNTFVQLPNGIMSSGSPGGNPAVGEGLFGPDVLVTTTAEMEEVGSIYNLGFTADGTNDIEIRFQPYAANAVHNQFFGINGFILDQGTAVVEPPDPTGPPCDLDGDGDCDGADLDELYAANGDIAEWLSQASADDGIAPGNEHRLGDANLDGNVDSTDLGLLLNNFNAAGGAAATWSGGDLDNSGNVNSTDLGLLLNNFNFTSASTNAVPEPNSFALLGLGFAMALKTLRRRRG